MEGSVREPNIFKKSSLALTALTISIILISVIFTADRMVTKENYSRNDYFEFVTLDDKLILCWVDYLQGNGRVWISSFDPEGNELVKPRMISRGERDSFTPKMVLHDKLLYVVWLEAKGETKVSRTDKDVDAVLKIASFDIDSLQGSGPYEEPDTLFELSTENYWLRFQNFEDSLSIQARITDHIDPGKGNVNYVHATTSDIAFETERGTEDHEFLIVELFDNGVYHHLIDSDCERILLPSGNADNIHEPLKRQYLFQFESSDLTTINSVSDLIDGSIDHSWTFYSEDVQVFGNALVLNDTVMFQGVWKGDDTPYPCILVSDPGSGDIETERINVTGYRSFHPLSWYPSGKGSVSLWSVFEDDDEFENHEMVLHIHAELDGNVSTTVLELGNSGLRSRTDTDGHMLIALKGSDGDTLILYRSGGENWSEGTPLIEGKGLSDLNFTLIMGYVITTYLLVFVVLFFILDRNKKRKALRDATKGSMVELNFVTLRKCLPRKYRHLDDRAIFDLVLRKYQPPLEDDGKRNESQSFFMMKFVYIGATMALVLRFLNILFWMRLGTSTFPLYMVGYTPYIEVPLISILLTYSIWNMSDIKRKGSLKNAAVLFLFIGLVIGLVQSMMGSYVAFLDDPSVYYLFSILSTTGPLLMLGTLFAPFMAYAEMDENPGYLSMAGLMVFAFAGAFTTTLLFDLTYSYQLLPHSIVVDNWLTSMLSLITLAPMVFIGTLLMGGDIDLKEITRDRRFARDFLRKISSVVLGIAVISILLAAFIGLILMWDLGFFFHWAMFLILLVLVGLSISLYRMQMNERLEERMKDEPIGNILKSYLTPLIFAVDGFVAGVFTGPIGIVVFTVISLVLVGKVHLRIKPIIEEMDFGEVVKGRERRKWVRYQGRKNDRRDDERTRAGYYRRMFSEELPDEIFLTKINKEYRDVIITLPIVWVLVTPIYFLIHYATRIHQFEPWVMWSITIAGTAAFFLLSYREMVRNGRDIRRIDYPVGLVKCLTAVPNAGFTAGLIVFLLVVTPNFFAYILIMISAMIFEMMIYRKNREWILKHYETFKPYQKRVTPIQMIGMETTDLNWFFGSSKNMFRK